MRAGTVPASAHLPRRRHDQWFGARQIRERRLPGPALTAADRHLLLFADDERLKRYHPVPKPHDSPGLQPICNCHYQGVPSLHAERFLLGKSSVKGRGKVGDICAGDQRNHGQRARTGVIQAELQGQGPLPQTGIWRQEKPH